MKKGTVQLTLFLLAIVTVLCISLTNAWGDTTSCRQCHGTHDNCFNCHSGIGPGPHHSTDDASAGNCEYCHADPRGNVAILNSNGEPLWDGAFPGDNGYLSGLNAPTQMACRECHISFSNGKMTVTKFTRSNYDKYTIDYVKTPVHVIDNPDLAALGRINNYGICFSCHGNSATTVTVWHARPDKHSSVYVYGGYNDERNCTGDREVWDDRWLPPEGWARYLPGRSSGTISGFNLFKDPGFGYTPTQYDYDVCSDEHLYSTNKTGKSFKRITVPAVLGNGNTTGSVPVFASICPYTAAGMNCPLQPPVLTSEPDLACEDNCLVTLNWSGVSDPDVAEVGYKVEVDDNADFSSVNYTSNWITSTSFSVSLATSKTYYWHVTARDNDNPSDISAWSAKDSFKLNGPEAIPGVPSLVWPPNNYYDQVGYPAGQNALRWSSSVNAAQYYCEIKKYGVVVKTSGWISGTSFNPGDLTDNVTYTWRVKARSAFGVESGWSATRSWYDYWW